MKLNSLLHSNRILNYDRILIFIGDSPFYKSFSVHDGDLEAFCSSVSPAYLSSRVMRTFSPARSTGDYKDLYIILYPENW